MERNRGLKEKGYPVVSMTFGGLIGPKGLPRDVVTKIDAAFKKSALDERFKSAARQSSQDAIYRDSSGYAQVLSEALPSSTTSSSVPASSPHDGAAREDPEYPRRRTTDLTISRRGNLSEHGVVGSFAMKG